jgi:hypothetical protein
LREWGSGGSGKRIHTTLRELSNDTNSERWQDLTAFCGVVKGQGVMN